MERFTLSIGTDEADDIGAVAAAVWKNEVGLAAFRGDLYRDGRLYVGYIETHKPFRGKGVATRLLLYAVDVLRVSTLAAGTISPAADRLFEKVGELRPDLVLDID